MLKANVAARAATETHAYDWRATTAKHEAALRAYYDSFPARSKPVAEFAADLAKRPAPKPAMRRTDDQFDAEREADQQGISITRYLRGY
jgi:hypothetical protein